MTDDAVRFSALVRIWNVTGQPAISAAAARRPTTASRSASSSSGRPAATTSLLALAAQLEAAVGLGRPGAGAHARRASCNALSRTETLYVTKPDKEMSMAFARVVAFDGVTKERIEALRREIGEGGRPEEVPATEIMVLHDAEGERSLAILFFETEDDYARATRRSTRCRPATHRAAAPRSRSTRSRSGCRPSKDQANARCPRRLRSVASVPASVNPHPEVHDDGLTPLDGDQLEALAANFGGTLLLPSDDGLRRCPRVHNGLIDRRPALIARCSGTADVAAAVRFGREAGLEISVRGGGHNVAGRAVSDGGLMIDLSLMKGIHVDAQARTARAQGGVTWSELNREAAVHGLAVTGGAISSTGIAGYTLGGGLGWLMSTQGLAADNLIGVQLVTADGEVLDVSDDSHPDLMWALRGGGGNFGVAASFEYRLRPQPMVVGGLIAHPVEAAGDLLRFYRDAAANCPDELTVFAALAHAPDGSGHEDRGR